MEWLQGGRGGRANQNWTAPPPLPVPLEQSLCGAEGSDVLHVSRTFFFCPKKLFLRLQRRIVSGFCWHKGGGPTPPPPLLLHPCGRGCARGHESVGRLSSFITPPPPKSHCSAPTQRHVSSKCRGTMQLTERDPTAHPRFGALSAHGTASGECYQSLRGVWGGRGGGPSCWRTGDPQHS